MVEKVISYCKPFQCVFRRNAKRMWGSAILYKVNGKTWLDMNLLEANPTALAIYLINLQRLEGKEARMKRNSSKQLFLDSSKSHTHTYTHNTNDTCPASLVMNKLCEWCNLNVHFRYMSLQCGQLWKVRLTVNKI